jgi:diacylglycerol O-acyltransferase / wax synthase
MVMDRLTPQDLMNLWPDDLGWPMDLGALAILDGVGLRDAQARFDLEPVRTAVEGRLSVVPRFRQVLLTPRPGLGRPLWVDAQTFDVRDHVGVLPLVAGADERELLAAVEQLRSRRLDRSRPLWEMWLLPGLSGGRVGMFIRLHHTVADGVAGAATLGALLDEEPDAPGSPATPWTPRPPPTSLDLLLDNIRHRVAAVRHLVRLLARPVATAHQVRLAWPAARVGLFDRSAPRTSLNRPVGAHRRFMLVRARLDSMKDIAHAHGGTVNDVLLAAVAGGTRQLLARRGDRVEGVVLRAFVPVSLHREGPGRARGNEDAVMVARLPIGEPDDLQRLRMIAAQTGPLKRTIHSPALNAFPSGLVQRFFWRMAKHQRYVNLAITNVPGPSRPLYLAGARVLELFPVAPISINMTLGIGALSYAGQFAITAIADRDACPDVDVFTDGLRSALQTLTRSELGGVAAS